ncbi:MAG: hypothetical protein JXB13_00330 [Phycisphaerae bacterium]|nr:hypothetical protein [Phycisphaerae bacterium]
MYSWFRQVDDLLRGRRTAPEILSKGEIPLPLRVFTPMSILLGLIYGFFMGWYALFSRENPAYAQMLASTVKLPALFLLTLIVTFPSLYVFNALVGCRLSFSATLRLLVGVTVVNATVAASFGPILGFFTLSTTSYPFMILLNVVLLALAGAVALTFLLHTLRRLAAVPYGTPLQPLPPATELDTPQRRPEPGPLDTPPVRPPAEAIGQAQSIFRIWVLIYGLVGAQMGWLLRPFIGSPNMPFEWFRAREGNFFQAVTQQIQNLLGA